MFSPLLIHIFYLVFYRLPVLAHMSMVSKVKPNMDSTPKLNHQDYLRKEIINEKKAAMVIVDAILHHFNLSLKKVDEELAVRPDEGWDSPGIPLDLKFLNKLKN